MGSFRLRTALCLLLRSGFVRGNETHYHHWCTAQLFYDTGL